MTFIILKYLLFVLEPPKHWHDEEICFEKMLSVYDDRIKQKWMMINTFEYIGKLYVSR